VQLTATTMMDFLIIFGLFRLNTKVADLQEILSNFDILTSFSIVNAFSKRERRLARISVI